MVSKGVVRILPSLSRDSTAIVSTRVPSARKVTRKKNIYILIPTYTNVYRGRGAQSASSPGL